MALEKMKRASLNYYLSVKKAFVAQGIRSKSIFVRFEVSFYNCKPACCAKPSVCQIPAESRRPVSYCVVAKPMSGSVFDELLFAVIHHCEDFLVAHYVIVLEQIFAEVVHPLVFPVVFVVLHRWRPHEKVQSEQFEARFLLLFLREKTRTEKRNLQIARLFHSELITSEGF